MASFCEAPQYQILLELEFYLKMLIFLPRQELMQNIEITLVPVWQT